MDPYLTPGYGDLPIGGGYDPGAGIVPVDEVFEPAPIDHWFAVRTWDASFELGINGSDGNSQTFNLHTGFDLERNSEAGSSAIGLRYARSTSNRVESQHNAHFDIDLERNFIGSRWSAFAKTELMYDEFKSFDYRLGINGGLGYAILDTESTTLKLRSGAGTSREFGGPNNNWTPEAVFGLDLTRQMTRRQKLNATVDFYPDWRDFSDYRAVTDIGWELLVDGEANLSLKLSVLDEYDSTPNAGDVVNDITYALLLLWKL